eukprot:754273-Hanusia_phi.AAC.7
MSFLAIMSPKRNVWTMLTSSQGTHELYELGRAGIEGGRGSGLPRELPVLKWCNKGVFQYPRFRDLTSTVQRGTDQQLPLRVRCGNGLETSCNGLYA